MDECGGFILGVLTCAAPPDVCQADARQSRSDHDVPDGPVTDDHRPDLDTLDGTPFRG